MTLPIVVSEGGPRERGRCVGRALPDAVGRSLDGFALERERLGVDRTELDRRVAPLVALSDRMLPALVERLRGLAEGADVAFVDVFAVNAWEEVLRDEAPAPGRAADRCTSIAVRTPGGVLLGHNEQWTASELGNVAIVVERMTDGPSIVSPTPASMLPSAIISCSAP